MIHKHFDIDLETNNLCCIFALQVFFVCWTPYALLCIYAIFFEVSSLPLALIKLPPITAKMASILNPIVYMTVDVVCSAIKGRAADISNKKEN